MPRLKSAKSRAKPKIELQRPNTQGRLSHEAILRTLRRGLAAMKKAGNKCELVGYAGEGHSFFNKEKYLKLTIAETHKFRVGLGWLKKQTGKQ